MKIEHGADVGRLALFALQALWVVLGQWKESKTRIWATEAAVVN